MRLHQPAFATLALLFASSQAFAAESEALSQCHSLMNEGKVAEAEPFCIKAAAALPELEGKLLLADVQYFKRDFDAAIKQYAKIVPGLHDSGQPDPVQLTALAHRARAYFASGSDALAEFDAEHYLKYQPDDVDILLIAAYATRSDKSRVEYYQRLVALQPGDLQMRLSLTNAYITAGQGKEAVAAADKALELDPKSDVALTMRGFAHIQAGDHGRAEKDLMTVVRRLPKDAAPRANLAEGMLRMGRFAETIEAASEALRLDPDNVRAYATRARARLEMGDGEGALADEASARRASAGNFTSDIEQNANIVIEAQKRFSREGLAALEADRAVILGAAASHLRTKCGYFSQPDYEDNKNLNAYRSCIVSWANDETGEFGNSLSPAAMSAAERFFAHEKWLPVGAKLRCSVMPRKARCIDDALHARAEAALMNMDDPRIFVGTDEFDRLNREVDAYNARLNRTEKINKYVSFMQALSDALAAQ